MAIAAVADRRRYRAMIENEFADEIVEGARGDAGLNMVGDHVETGGGDAPGFAHAVKVFCGVKLDRAGAVLHLVIVEHGLSHHGSNSISSALRRTTSVVVTSQS